MRNENKNIKFPTKRIYVQPQWIFDCINENMLLPVEEYLPGACLPPHLSPFVDHNETSYVPPEKQRLINMKLGITNTEEPVAEVSVTHVKKRENSEKASQKSEIKKVEKVVAKPVKEEEIIDESVVADNGMRVDLDSPGEESIDEDTEISESEDETVNKDVRKVF